VRVIDRLRGVGGSCNLAHHIAANEFFTRLAVEANAAGGELTEWYGVRMLAHLFSGVIVQSAAAVSNVVAPLSVTVWNREESRSVLAIVTHSAHNTRSDSPSCA